MNDPSHYPSEQPGLEVGVPSVQHQYAGHNKAPSPYDEAASKEAIPYRQQAGLEPVPPQPPPSRVCGLPKRKFWIVLALGILVIGAALGGGLGGGLSGRHRTATGTPEQTTSSSAVSASTTASTTASTAAATSSIQPFNTSPGTYRIVNVATNTAIDLLNGGTTNDTEIECWSFTPGTSESNSPHQSWLISNPDTTNLSLVTIYNLASKVYITAPLGLDPSQVSGGQTYGAVPGNPSDPHAQFVIVHNSDNSISFKSTAYPTWALNLDGSNPANGTPVLVWNIGGSGLNQDWILVPYS